MLISDRIFELIKERKMTQKEFSRQTGIPQSTISDWRGKKLNPSSDKIMVICNVLNVSPTELLTGFSEHTPQGTADDVPQNYVLIQKDSLDFELINSFHSMDEKSRNRLLGYLTALSEEQSK